MINMRKKIALIIPPFGRQQQRKLAEGVDILICTPRTFGRVIKDKLIRLRRLSHVVLEKANELFELFSDEIEVIFSIFHRVQSKYKVSMQMIAVSQEWSPGLERFAKQLYSMPLICIGSYLEAALYGRTDIIVKFAESSSKHSQVVDIIKTKSQLYKTILICDELTEFDNLTDYLHRQGFVCLMLNSKSTIDDIKLVCSRWSTAICGEYRVLVTTDDVLNTALTITDASIVIQNSMPISWSQFAFRFSSFTDNYSSPLIQNKNKKSARCKMHIFLDETNLEQFPRIVQLLQRMGCNLNKNILDKYTELLNKIELEKVLNNVDICDKIKLLGLCPAQITCKARHMLSPDDQRTRLPASGLVKLKVLHIRSVTSFYARLIEYTDAKGVAHEVKDRYTEIAVQMIKLANATDRFIAVECDVGSFAAVEERNGIFRRCVVIRVEKHGILNQPVVVAVRLLDTGAELIVPTSNLFIVSENLKKIPPQAVEIYLANMGPPDRDSYWSQLCVNRLDTEFNEADYEDIDSYFTGRIKLQLGNAIWVDNLTLKTYLDNGSLVVNKLAVRHVLLNKNLADERPEHMQHLYALCKLHNLELPNYSLPKDKEQTGRRRQHKPMWAHLDNLTEYNCVFMSTAQSPDNFYLRLAKNQDLLEAYINEIRTTISKPLYPCVFEVFEGHFYLGKDPQEDFYARVLVTKLENDLAHCFFVDYGDTIALPIIDLKFLSDDLITKLPFQIIECNLWGVAPKNSQPWLSEATDIFYDIAFEPDSDFYRPLYAKVVSDSQPEVTGFKKYAVILIDTFVDQVIVNDLLVLQGFAVRTEEMVQVDFNQCLPKINALFDNDSDMKNNNYDEKIEEIKRQPEYQDDDYNEIDLQIYDSKAFFTGLLKNLQPSVEPNVPINAKPSYPIVMKALPSPDYSTPDVVWEQTGTKIVLHIKLPGVREYKLKLLRNRILTFKTEMQTPPYRLDLILFAKVASEIEHCALGLYVLVKLTKQTDTEWNRLVFNTERLRYITYNLSGIKIEDDDSDVEPDFTKQKHPKTDDDDGDAKFVYEYGSDIDYNESDIESDSTDD